MAVGNTPLFIGSVVATAALTHYRAATFAGALPVAGANVQGFCRTGGAIGDRVPVDMLGSTIAEASAAVAVGALLEVIATGQVVTRTPGAILGRALTAAAAAGDQVEVFLIPN